MIMKETDLFPPLKEWLEERSYEVFTEVQSRHTGGRADIVAVSGPAVAVVEMKNSLSLELIGQAIRWKPYANYVYVAVPEGRKRHDHGSLILRREGIGLIEVNLNGRWGASIYCRTPAKFNRRVNDHIRQSLVPQHKDLPGGHAGGGYVTDYKLTIDRVKDFLRYHTRKTDGWSSMNEILDHCETHYSSPKPSLAAALKSFESDWCETKVEGRKLHFRMKAIKTD